MIDQLETIGETATDRHDHAVGHGRARGDTPLLVSLRGTCQDIRYSIKSHEVGVHGDANRNVTAKKLIPVCCEISIQVHHGSPFIWRRDAPGEKAEGVRCPVSSRPAP